MSCENSPKPNQVTQVFNVGGTKYEVSRSLLNQHPDTMLARMASETWQQQSSNSTSSIFIERDGALFRYVLQYMRDGQVTLPVSESKTSLLHELTYYGFEDINENCIDCSMALKEVVDYLVCENVNQQLIEHGQTLRKAMKRLKQVEQYADAAKIIAEDVEWSGKLKLVYSLKSAKVYINTSFESSLPMDMPWKAFFEGDESMISCKLFETIDEDLLNDFLEKFNLRVSRFLWDFENSQDREEFNGFGKFDNPFPRERTMTLVLERLRVDEEG